MSGKKMQARPRDKMQEPGKNKAKSALEKLTAQVRAGQQVMSSEEADEAIGEADEAYRALVQAVRAATMLQWMMAKGQGARETPAALRMQAQNTVILLDLVHKAYAAGVRHGLLRA